MPTQINNPLLNAIQGIQQNTSIYDKTPGSFMDTTNYKKAELEQVSPEKIAILEDFFNRAAAQKSIFNMDGSSLQDIEAVIRGGFIGSDTYRLGSGSLMRGIGTTLDGIARGSEWAEEGLIAANPNHPIAMALRAAQGIRDSLGIDNPLSTAGQFITEQGQETLDQISPSLAEEMADSQFSGDLDKPSTWSLGSNPTARGVAANIGGVIVESAPSLAAAVSGAGLGAVVGGAQALGATAQEVEDVYGSMSHDQLLNASTRYKELVNSGISQEQAKEQIIKEASITAGTTAGLVAGAGGAALGKILDPVSRLGRIGANSKFAGITRGVSVGSAAAVEGATSEVAETVLSRAASNFAIGGNRDVWEDTFADAVYGLAADAIPATAIGTVRGRLEKITADIADKKALQKDIRQSITEGQVDQFLDPTKATYDPKGVYMQALAILQEDRNNKAAQNTLKTSSAAIAKRIAQLDADISEVEGDIGGSVDDILNAAEVAVKNAATPEARERSQMLLDTFKRQGAPVKAAMKERDDLSKLLDLTSGVTQFINSNQIVTPEKINQVLQEVSDQNLDPEQREQSAAKLYKMAVYSPESVTPEVVQAVENSQLSDTVKNLMRTTLSTNEAIQRRISIESVRSDILNGDGKFRGVNSYRTSMYQAIEAGDIELARSTTRTLGMFARQMVAKANAIQQAYEQAKQTNQNYMVLREGNNYVVRPQGNVTNAEVKRAKGYVVHKGSNQSRFIDAVVEDATIARNAFNELRLQGQAAFTEKTKLVEDLNPITQPVYGEPPLLTDIIEEPEQEASQEAPEAVVESEPEQSEGEPEQPTNEQQEAVQEPVQEEAAVAEEPVPEREVSALEKRLIDIIDNEKYSELDTVQKVLNFTKAYRETLNKYLAADKDSLSDAEFEVYDILRNLSEDTNFDWDSLLDGMDPTEEQTQQFQNAIQGVEETSVEEEAETEVVTQLTPENFKEVNLIEVSTTKQSNSIVGKTPLREVIQNNPEVITDRFGELTERQETLLGDFLAHVDRWRTRLAELFIPKRQDLKYTDLVQFFEENGALTEDAVTAISYGAYSWVAEFSSLPPRNTNAAINAMLGRDESHAISASENAAYRRNGVTRQLAIQEIGQKAFDSLGIKFKQNYPLSLRNQLISSLGVYGYQLLVSDGLVNTYESLSPEEVDNNSEAASTVPVSETARHKSIMVSPYDSQFNQSESLKSIREAYSGTQSFLTKLLTQNTEEQVTDVIWSSEVKDLDKLFNQVTASKRQEGIPKKQIEIEKKKAKIKWYVRPEAAGVWESLDDSTKVLLAGGYDLDGPVQVELLDGYTAKNEALLREIDYMSSLANDPRSTEEGFHLVGNVWSIHRAGYISSVNPQTSKIMRHLVRTDTQVSEVSMDPESDSYKFFMLGLAQSLGINIDNQDPATSIAKAEAIIQREDVQRVVQAISEGEITSEIQTEMIQLVQDFGEGMASFDALIAISDMSRNNGQTFTTSLLPEVDGKTNGPMLTYALYGAADTPEGLLNKLNAGGFYEEGSFNNFYEYKEDSGKDLYEKIAEVLYRSLSEVTDPRMKKYLSAISYFIGSVFNPDINKVTSSGRNLTKLPTTSLIFGSGMDKAVESGGYRLVEKIRERMSEISQGGTEQELATFKRAVQFLYGKEIIALNVPDPSLLYQVKLPSDFDRVIVNNFTHTYGEHLGFALESIFGDFLEDRKIYYEATSLAYSLYEAVEQYVTEQEIQRLMEAGELPYTTNKQGQKVPLASLTAKQQRALDKRLEPFKPMLKTMMGIQSDEGAENGIFMSKVSRKFVTPSTNAAEIQNKYSRPYTQEVKVEGASGIRAMALTNFRESPGVNGVINSVHSFDSSISLNTLEKVDGLNIHDAIGVGVNQLQETAKTLNEVTYKNLATYHAPLEIMDLTERVIEAVNDLLDQESTPKELMNRLHKVIEDNLETITNLPSTESLAREATLRKLDMLAMTGSVDQYTFPDGNYSVEDSAKEVVTKEKVKVTARAVTLAPKARQLADRVAKDSADKLPPAIIKYLNNTLSAMREKYSREKSPELRQKGINLAKVLKAYINSGNLDNALKSVYTSGQQIKKLKAVIERESAKLINTPLTTRAGYLVGSEIIKAVEILKDNGIEVDINVSDIQGGLTLQDILDKPEYSNIDTHAALNIINRYIEAMGDNLLGSNLPINYDLSAAVKSEGATIRDIVKVLVSNASPAQRRVLQMVRPLLNLNIPIVVISKDKPFDLMDSFVQEDFTDSRGAYAVTKDGKEVIYLKDDSYENHGLSLETVLHELVHAATVKALKDPRNKGAVADLEAIREALQNSVVDSSPLAVKYAVTSVEELLAWGLSNREVQNALSKLAPVKPLRERVSERITNGLASFIRSVVALMTGKSNQTQENALGELLYVTSTLVNPSQTANEVNELYHQNPVDSESSKTTSEVFESLGSVFDNTQVSDPSLKKILDNIIQNVPTFDGFNILDADEGALLDFYKNHKVPVAAIRSSTLKMSNQEKFVGEKVDLISRVALANNFKYSRRLTQLFNEAKKVVKPSDLYEGDWDTASNETKQNIERAYRDIFDATKPNYLSNFLAMSLVNKQLKTALNTVIPTIRNRENIWQRLESLFLDLLNWIMDRYIGSDSRSPLSKQIEDLAYNLSRTESKYRAALARKGSTIDKVVDTVVGGTVRSARSKMTDLLDSDFVKNSSNSFVRASSKIAKHVANGEIEEYLRVVNEIITANEEGKRSFIGSLIDEFVGSTDSTLFAETLLRATKQLEKRRADVAETDANILMNSFDNGGEYLEPIHKEAITKGLLKTNLQSLVNRFNYQDLEKLLTDRDFHKQETNKILGEIQKIADKDIFNEYVVLSKALGYFMVTGKVTVSGMLLNSEAIANRLGMDQEAPSYAVQVRPLIEQLTSLYAVSYLDGSIRTALSQVIATEGSRGPQNGIQATVVMHRNLINQSRDKLFAGSTHLMVDGYVSDILSSRMSLIVEETANTESLEALGYVPVGSVQIDSLDSSQTPKTMFIRDDGGLTPRVTGIMSSTANKRMGSQMTSNYRQQVDYLRRSKGQRQQNHLTFDPSASTETFALPTLTADGKHFSGLRYVASEYLRDSVLDRDNDFSRVLGYTHSRMFDKLASKEQNKLGLEALYAHYQEDYLNRPSAYVEISAKSDSEDLREYWRLLPEDSKKIAKSLWGSEKIVIPKELLNIFFGYRKYSIIQTFNKSDAERSAIEEVMVGLAEGLLGKKAGYYLKSGEDIWQYLVHQIKDIRVIRNLTTLIGNISSNLTVVWAYGGSFPNIAKDHLAGIEYAMAWQKDSKELDDLTRKLELGFITPTGDILSRIAQLEESLEKNPIKPIADAGMFQTIIEDIEPVAETDKYRNKLTDLIGAVEEVMPEPLVKIGKQLVVHPDTGLYKVLNRATQLSDFISRYALYQQLTRHAENRMSEKEAMKHVSEAFVNYDMPSGRWLQYLNDMGLMMFTKYYIRIQKVMMNLMSTNPARMIGVLLFDSYVNNVGNIGESYIWNKLPNLLMGGALEFPDALDEPIVMKMALSLLD